MGDREPARPAAQPARRLSAAPEPAEPARPLEDEVVEVPLGPDRPGGSGTGTGTGTRTERRSSGALSAVHHRHMPIAPLKLTIPRKTKENRGLLCDVSCESREFEDLMSVVVSSYKDANSASCFTYSNARLVHNQQLEREFVEKRKQLKSEGRADKELEESYCFLLSDSVKLVPLCEKGLLVGHSWITVLGNPSKGVYLSRFSDLLQVNPMTPGTSGELVIFKVMKGKVKSIYENMKNLLDPTPRFDSHISKNAGRISSLTAYRALELTQQYFYEYSFDELLQRPRQVCPYAVLSFHAKGKDVPLPSMPLAPVRMNSQSEDSKERALFTVWSGDLVKGDAVLFQIALRSASPPFLPHRLPEKLPVGSLMRLSQLTKLLPATLFSYNLYSSGQEVSNSGFFCSRLEVADKNRSTTSVKTLLDELENRRMVLVTLLSDRGFLLMLSSVQMAPPEERGEGWRRSLQALFVFPESRDVTAFGPQEAPPPPRDVPHCLPPPPPLMSRLHQLVPALHHALIKARANPPTELSAGVEGTAREYLTGLREGKVRPYPMGEYDSSLEGRSSVAPKQHRLNMESYLRCYLTSPAHYLLSLPRARVLVEEHAGPVAPPPPQEAGSRATSRDPREARRGEAAAAVGHAHDRQSNTQKVQRLIDLVKTCKRSAENEVMKDVGDVAAAPGRKRKRRLEQETAQRTMKLLKASRDTLTGSRASSGSASSPPGSASSPAISFSSLIGSLGLKDADLREEGSDLADTLSCLLTDLNQAVRGSTNQSLAETAEAGPRESCPFDRLATKLGLPTSCDIDLRRQEELEEQTGGSVSSLEGFSPGSHGGEMNQQLRGGGGGSGMKTPLYGEEDEEQMEIPWVLIPITGLRAERYSHRDRNLPEDPRFQRLPATGPAPSSSAPPTGTSPAPYQCLSPSPSPPGSASQCPSPAPSPPLSPAQCLSPAPSSPPSPEPRPPSSTWSLEPHKPRPLVREESAAGEERLAVPRETTGFSVLREVKSERKEEQILESLVPASQCPSSPPAPEQQSARGAEPQPLPEPTQNSWVFESLRNLKQEPDEGSLQPKVKEEVFGRGLSSAPPPPRRLRNIDSIINQHLGDFSSEMQRLLQDESVHCSLSQSPHSTSHGDSSSDTPPAQADASYHSTSQFSQYVSFYNPCPPVQDYVASLQDAIGGLVRELDATGSDTTLANDVSDFVASVRAGNTGRDGGAASAESCEETAASSGSLALSREDVDYRVPPSLRVTLTAPTPPPAVLRPAVDPDWSAQPSPSAGLVRTVTQDVRRPPDSPMYSGAPRNATPPPSEPDSSGGAGGPSSALSSLISTLQPEVFNNLVEIMKDVKKNSVQFYLHSTERHDPVDRDVKEHLLKQGNMELDPETFLSQNNPDSRLLVIIKNKDIAAHVHEIPGLVSLKRFPSVVFVGIDTLDDIRNNSYNELFQSGGCLIPDQLILSPDYMTADRLTALLVTVEQHSSPDSVWRWKIHCRTLKKLKEQARNRKDAADILDVLLAFQKRQLVEVLPYHRCDMMAAPPSADQDLHCLTEHQARYTQYRHTVFLTERQYEKLFSRGGVVVAGIDQILNDFSWLVGGKDRQTFADPPQTATGSSLSAAVFPNPSRPLQPPPPPLLPSAPDHSSDPPLSDSSPREDGVLPSSDSACLVLRQALSQLRAERVAQLQQLQEEKRRLEAQVQSCSASPDSSGRRTNTHSPTPQPPPPLTPGRTAVAKTLELLHQRLHGGQGEASTGGGVTGDRGAGQVALRAESAGGNGDPKKREASPFNQNPGLRSQSVITRGNENNSDGGASLPRGGGVASGSSSVFPPGGGDGLRAPPSGADQPITAESSKVGVAKVTGSVPVVTSQGTPQIPAVAPRRPSAPPVLLPLPVPRLPLPLPPTPRLPGFLGAGAPVWAPRLGAAWPPGQQRADPCGTPLLFNPSLLGIYHQAAAHGGKRFQGGQRGGGGFNGM